MLVGILYVYNSLGSLCLLLLNCNEHLIGNCYSMGPGNGLSIKHTTKTPDCPVCSLSLHRLSYTGYHMYLTCKKFWTPSIVWNDGQCPKFQSKLLPYATFQIPLS
jgi:hypothetical protein